MQIKLMLTTIIVSLGLLTACSQQSGEPYQNIPLSEFKEKMKGSDVVILDVRTPQETAQGKINGAIEIDYSSRDFDAKIRQLDKNKTYLVYCAVGSRSAAACDALSKKGFEKIYNLKGGYMGWKNAQ